MTRIVLLGAGASFGSVDVSPCCPPLATGLFDALASNRGVATDLPNDLKSKFRENFEKGMGEYFDHTDGDIQDFQRELGLYMAQFEPGPGNMYVRLIKELGISRCTLSTLNYDLLIELSAFALGHSVAYGVEYHAGCLRVLKPHGLTFPHFSPAV